MQAHIRYCSMSTRAGRTGFLIEFASDATDDRIRDVADAIKQAVKPYMPDIAHTAGLVCETECQYTAPSLPPCPPKPPVPTTADQLMSQAAAEIRARAAVRDLPEGERSMARTVAAFNAMYGTELSVTTGWQFMLMLKMARASAGAYHADDYIDQIGYAGLGAEAAEREHANGFVPG